MDLELQYYGNPCLREKALPVEEIDEEILELIEELKRLHFLHRGGGLAAPQVGVAKRVFIQAVRAVDANGYPIYGAPKVYINPKITLIGEETWIEEEGCLSIPKIYEAVERPYCIEVEALNEKGETFKERLEGWMAKPVLHENDHLNGVLFIDRIHPQRKKALSIQLKKIKKKYSK